MLYGIATEGLVGFFHDYLGTVDVYVLGKTNCLVTVILEDNLYFPLASNGAIVKHLDGYGINDTILQTE